MTKIALTVDAADDVMPVVTTVRAVTGRSVAEIARSARSGDPVAEFVLFGNDHETVATQLRRLAGQLSGMGGAVRAYELDDEESLADLSDPAVAEVSLETVTNILDAHDRELERQRQLSVEGR